MSTVVDEWQPKRLEIAIKHKGIDTVVIARENNDGWAFAYTYALTAKDNTEVEADSKHWVYPDIEIDAGGADEHCFGRDLEEGESDEAYEEYRKLIWTTATFDANRIAQFLQDK